MNNIVGKGISIEQITPIKITHFLRFNILINSSSTNEDYCCFSRVDLSNPHIFKIIRILPMIESSS